MANKKELQEKCTHYWIIGAQINGTSTGRCKLCNKRKKFNSSNSAWDKFDWRSRSLKFGKKENNGKRN